MKKFEKESLKEYIKANKIALGAVMVSIFIGGVTIWNVNLYRANLRLKYSPSIYPIIISKRNVHDPQIVICNFKDTITEISDYEIKFRAEKSGKEKIISRKDLKSGLIGKEIPPKRNRVFYFNNTVDDPIIDFLRENKGDVIICEGYIEVKNKMSPKEVKEIHFECKRSYDSMDLQKRLFWYPNPGPNYLN